MSRPSKAALSVVPFSGQTRLKPPDFLPERERAVFQSVIATVDPDHFRASDLPLLARYCEMTPLAEIAIEKARTQGLDWLQTYDKATRLLMSLATKLRLSPQARSRAAMRRPGQPQQASYYDLMNADNG